MNVIYPGSFDPLTNGHLDLIERCSKKFDNVIIGVLNNVSKKGIFSVDERIELIRSSTRHLSNIQIETFTGLLIDFAKTKDCPNIVRGLRAVSDLEYEMQLALANKKLYPDLETYFMVSNTEYSFLSSSIVKEIAKFDGDVNGLVPKEVKFGLIRKKKAGDL